MSVWKYERILEGLKWVKIGTTRMRVTIKEELSYRVRDYIRKPEDHTFPLPPTPRGNLDLLSLSLTLRVPVLLLKKKICINVHLWNRNMDCAKTNIKLLV